MRRWKSAKLPIEKVYLYFAEHPDKFFTPEHVAAQTGLGTRRVRRLVRFLEAEAKLEGVDTIAALRWGRPRRFYRCVRTVADSLHQLEVFRDSLAAAGFGDPYG